jgi:hypothetical protein
MRKRGFIFILAAIPAWLFFLLFWNRSDRSPFGYPLGTNVGSLPPAIRVVDVIAAVCTVLGVCFLLFDLIRWIRNGGS